MGIRYAFCLGTNSIGWAVYEVKQVLNRKTCEPVRLLDLGVDEQDKASPVTNRRDARRVHSNRDWDLQRRQVLMNALVFSGLMPEDEVQHEALVPLDLYLLRKRALDEELKPYEIGSCLLHLNQHRGFKSNRKTDAKNEGSNRKDAIKSVGEKMKMSGVRTIGERRASRHENKQGVRFRGGKEGQKMNCDVYPERDMIEDEFAQIWEAQKSHHPDILTEQTRDKLHEIIFYQRPLKPVPAGKCTFNPDEDRAPHALPSYQYFRILQDLNHLRVSRSYGEKAEPLTKEQRDKLLKKLQQGEAVAFKRIRADLKLPDTATFTLQDDRRQEIDGDQTARIFSANGIDWNDLPRERQDEIVMKLVSDDDEIKPWLCQELAISEQSAEEMMDASLEAGYVRIGPTALNDIIPFMEAEVITYDAAAEKAGYDHTDPHGDTGEICKRLPPYQEVETFNRQLDGTGDESDPVEKRYGRFSNPIVHNGLNQLREVVNALANRHGPADEIVLEQGRDLKNSQEDRDRIKKEQTQNQKKNDERRQKLKEMKQPDNPSNMMRLRLWEELNPGNPLDRRCPFTGVPISCRMLFSGEAEEEHILPLSRTSDDSHANRTITTREANRAKGDRSPAEAVAQGIFKQDHIDRAIANAPDSRKWRFATDAMERYENEEQIPDRQLPETSWLSKLARSYLEVMTGRYNVWPVTGQLISSLRSKWELNRLLGDHNGNQKKRIDQAIDAAVIGVSGRRLVKKFAEEAGRRGKEEAMRLEISPPYEEYRDQVSDAVDRIIVAH